MKTSIVGTGYAGLMTGTCFAETANQLTCVDVDEGKVQKLTNGIISMHEPGSGSCLTVTPPKGTHAPRPACWS
ncbi:hypothetical protein ACO2Q8_14000 [Larkinella sp. VNQ87]|uniref:hypothetical protein n=1 Tax=Larkinella sp. VNQ87 TaxID=3400921 RepID=UPI003C0CE78D